MPVLSSHKTPPSSARTAETAISSFMTCGCRTRRENVGDANGDTLVECDDLAAGERHAVGHDLQIAAGRLRQADHRPGRQSQALAQRHRTGAKQQLHVADRVLQPAVRPGYWTMKSVKRTSRTSIWPASEAAAAMAFFSVGAAIGRREVGGHAAGERVDESGAHLRHDQFVFGRPSSPC